MLKEAEFFDFLRSGGAEDVRKTQASYTGEEAQLAARFQEVRGRLAAVGAELDALERNAKGGLSESDRARRTALERDRDVGQQAFERFLGELMKELGSTVTAERNRDIGRRNLADVQALQQTLSALGHGAVTLHYLVLEDRTHIILTTPQVQLVQESPVKSAELNKLIQRYREVLQDPRRDPLTLAQELYRILIGPIAQDLAQAKAGTLMISLDGALRYLPFAALHDGKQYLAESYALSIYTEAAKDRLRERPPRSGSSRGSASRARSRASARCRRCGPSSKASSKAASCRAKCSSTSSSTMHSSARRWISARPYCTSPATSYSVPARSRIRSCCSATARGCHLRTSRPTASGTSISSRSPRAKRRSAADATRTGARSKVSVRWRSARAPMACSQRSGRSLTRARARSCVSSTASGRPRPGMTKAGALRQAQMGFIRGAKGNKAYSHPFYWAPFILMGNWL